MEKNDQDFQTLQEGIRQGSPEAARVFIDTYGHHVLHVIRRKLNRRLRLLFDSDDFMQQVWLQFFTRWVYEKNFDRGEELIAFLARMAQSRVVDASRQYLQRAKYDLNRQQPLDDSPSRLNDLSSRECSAADDVLVREEWARLVQNLPRGQRQIVYLLQEGHSTGEIAVMLGVTENTIRRLVRIMSEKLLSRQRCDPPVAQPPR